MNSKKKININPNDITKIPSELILKITLKNGTKLILDEKCPMQDINKLIITIFKILIIILALKIQ